MKAIWLTLLFSALVALSAAPQAKAEDLNLYDLKKEFNVDDCREVMNRSCEYFEDKKVFALFEEDFFNLKLEIERKGGFPLKADYLGRRLDFHANAEIILVVTYARSATILRAILTDKDLSSVTKVSSKPDEETLRITSAQGEVFMLRTFTSKADRLRAIFACKDFDGIKRWASSCKLVPRMVDLIFHQPSRAVLSADF